MNGAFKLVGTIWVTDVGMASLGRIATHLKIFLCRTCWSGAKALNVLLSQSSSLEIISVQKLYGIFDSGSALKVISIRKLYGIFDSASALEVISVRKLYGIYDSEVIYPGPIPGAATSSLISIYLNNIDDPACPRCLALLITGS